MKTAGSNFRNWRQPVTHWSWNLPASRGQSSTLWFRWIRSRASTSFSKSESRTITEMPLNARQFLGLALVTPGVLPSAARTQGGGFNVAGARSQSNMFLLDGVSNVDTQINSALGNFRITDAVQEFAVQTSVPTAEFGRGTGGQISIVTKSGSNQFHGPAFEYLR